MKYFIITILITITACSHRQLPHQQPLHRDVVADIIMKNEYEKQQATVTIVDRNEALDLLNSEVK
jgi:hypothetical protein